MAGGGGGGGLGRLLGIGFLLGAKDQGATKKLDDVGKKTDEVGKKGKKAGDDASQGLQRIGNAINALSLAQLGRIAGALGNLAERAGAASSVATTSLESWGAQFGQTWRQASAGLGEFGANLQSLRRPAAAVAFNLQIDAGQILAVGRGAAQAGNELEDFGLTARGVGGAIQAGVIQGDSFGNMLNQMRSHFGLTAEDAGRLIDDITVIGERSGDAGQAIQGMPEALAGLREATAEFPGLRRQSGNLMRGLYQLARGMYTVSGGSMTEALQSASQVFSQLTGQRRELRQLFTGLGSQFPTLAQEIGIASGDIEGSLATIMSDPVAFARNVSQTLDRVGRSSVAGQRLIDVMTQMGPQFVRLVDGSEESRRTLGQLSEGLGNTSGAFERFAQAASGSTRTFAESMDLASEMFQNRINTMMNRVGRTRPEFRNFDRQVLQAQRRAFRSLGDRVERMANRNGPYGMLTRAMIGLRRGGVVGLSVALRHDLQRTFPQLSRQIGTILPQLAELGDGFWEAAQQVAPMLVAMGQLNMLPNVGRYMRLLINPVTLAAGALYLFYRYGDQIGPVLTRLSQELLNFSRRFSTTIGQYDWEQIGRDIFQGILVAFGRAGDATSPAAAMLGEAMRNIFGAVWQVVRGLATGLWESIVEWVTSPDNILGQVRRGATVAGVVLGAAMFTPMRGPILWAAGQSFGLVWRGVSALVGPASSGIRAVAGAAARGGTALARSISSVLFQPTIGVLGVQASARGPLGSAFARVGASMSGFARGIPRALGGAGAGISRAFGGIGASLAGIFRGGGGAAAGVGGRAVAGVAGRTLLRSIPYVGAILGVLFDLPTIIGRFRAGELVGGINEIFRSILNGVLLGIPGLIRQFTGFDILGPIVDFFMDLFGISRIWGAIESGNYGQAIAEGLWNMFSAVFGNIPNLIRTVIQRVTGRDIFGDITGRLGEMFGSVWEGIREAARILRDLFGEIQSIFMSVITPIFQGLMMAWDSLSKAFGEVWDAIRPALEEMWTAIRDAFSGVVEAIQGAWTSIVEAVRPVIDAVRQVGVVFVEVWRTSIAPALSQAWAFIRQVFVERVLPMARRVFQEIGRFFRWLWRDVAVPALENMGRAFVGACRWMSEVGVQVFTGLAVFITNRIFDIIRAIVTMRERWNWFKNTVAAGGRYVGEVIRTSLTIPFLTARRTWMTVSDAIANSFDVLRLGVLDLVRQLVVGLRTAIANIPGIGSMLAAQFAPAEEAVNRYYETERQATDTRRRQREADARALQAQIDQEVAARLAAQEEVERVYREGAAAEARAAREVEQGRQEATDALIAAAPRLRQAFAQAARELNLLVSEEGRVELRRRATERREREMQQRAVRAQPAFQAIARATRGGRLTVEEATALRGAIMESVQAGREVDVQRAVAAVSELPARRARGRAAAMTTVTEAFGIEPPAAPAEQAPAETPTTRRAAGRRVAAERQERSARAREAETAAAVEQAIEVARFGAEAARQLADALSITIEGMPPRRTAPAPG